MRSEIHRAQRWGGLGHDGAGRVPVRSRAAGGRPPLRLVPAVVCGPWPLACCLLLAGCTYRKVVSYNAPLAGLPGAVSGTAETRDHLRRIDPTATPDGQIRVENPDGSVTLYSRSPRHLMRHIYQTLENGERELFVEQVMCARTRREFRERGYAPGEGFDELVRRREDVLKLFNAMPQGEYTPGVLWEKLGEKTYRLKVTGLGARDLEWSFMDMVLEEGNWKLRWFGG